MKRSKTLIIDNEDANLSEHWDESDENYTQKLIIKKLITGRQIKLYKQYEAQLPICFPKVEKFAISDLPVNLNNIVKISNIKVFKLSINDVSYAYFKTLVSQMP